MGRKPENFQGEGEKEGWVGREVDKCLNTEGYMCMSTYRPKHKISFNPEKGGENGETEGCSAQ